MAFFGPKELCDYNPNEPTNECEKPHTSFLLSHSFDGKQHCKIHIYKDLDWAVRYLDGHFDENMGHVNLIHRVNTMQIIATLMEDDLRPHVLMVMITVDPRLETFKVTALLRDRWKDESARIVLNYIDNRWFTLYRSTDDKISPERTYKDLGGVLDAIRIATT